MPPDEVTPLLLAPLPPVPGGAPWRPAARPVAAAAGPTTAGPATAGVHAAAVTPDACHAEAIALATASARSGGASASTDEPAPLSVAPHAPAARAAAHTAS
jgi:hypothetical protein